VAVSLDFFDEVSETDEADNEYTKTLTIIDPPASNSTADVVLTEPPCGAVDVPTDTDLTIFFSTNVVKGTGNIVIRRKADDAVVDSIPVTDPSVTVNGPAVSIALGSACRKKRNG
jgi:hypothetical protein